MLISTLKETKLQEAKSRKKSELQSITLEKLSGAVQFRRLSMGVCSVDGSPPDHAKTKTFGHQFKSLPPPPTFHQQATQLAKTMATIDLLAPEAGYLVAIVKTRSKFWKFVKGDRDQLYIARSHAGYGTGARTTRQQRVVVP